IPNVSSFYFLGDNKMVVSSYGRGLWKLSLPACRRRIIPIDRLQVAEPLIYWKGAYVPISQIHNPDVCPVCGYFITQQGDITEINVSNENEIKSLSLSGGSIQGFTYENKSIDRLPFQLSTSVKSF